MISQRFVDTNPQSNLGVSGLARVPQQARAVPRASGVPLLTTSHAPWGTTTENFPSGTAATTLTVSDTGSFDQLGLRYKRPNNITLRRCIYHPGYDKPIEYPDNPDRTVNYYRSAIRKHKILTTQTLSSNITVRDLQACDDVIISETWEGGGKRLSALAEFFDTLHLFRITEPALGRAVGWIPKDLGFQRHLIQPLSLSVGGSDLDVREIRPRANTSIDSYLDKQITFSFKLLRPMPLIDSLLVMEGR